MVRNVTMVVPLEREVELKRYWSGVFNSPVESSWLRKGLNVTAWEVGGAGAGLRRETWSPRARHAGRAAVARCGGWRP